MLQQTTETSTKTQHRAAFTTWKHISCQPVPLWIQSSQASWYDILTPSLQ